MSMRIYVYVSVGVCVVYPILPGLVCDHCQPHIKVVMRLHTCPVSVSTRDPWYPSSEQNR